MFMAKMKINYWTVEFICDMCVFDKIVWRQEK